MPPSVSPLSTPGSNSFALHRKWQVSRSTRFYRVVKGGSSRVKRIWNERGLAIVLAALFLGSWAIQGWTGWEQFQSEQQQHEQSAHFWGQDGYIWTFGEATFENWQSEFLQLLTFVVLTAALVYKGSPESKDGDEEMKQMLLDIQRRLDSLPGRQ
jgi:hypothetical protein